MNIHKAITQVSNWRLHKFTETLSEGMALIAEQLMHFVIEPFLSSLKEAFPWLIIGFRFLQQLLGFGKGTLETVKTAKEIFNDTKSLMGQRTP